MHETFEKARKHLARRDAVLKSLIRTVGPCSLRIDREHFQVLVRSIVSQQISTKAAASISGKLLLTLENELSPQRILRASEVDLRGAGLSQSKVHSLRDLAERCVQGSVDLATLHEKPDDEVIRELLPIRGIGPWTADMFLIFSLGRLDVLPIGDYGLKAGLRNQYGLAEIPSVAEIQKIAECWRPFRSIGTWYIWRSFGNVPQS